MKLKGKVCIITGASGGIGMATCTTFASEGAAIMLTGRNEKRCRAIMEDLRHKGCRASYITGDTRDPVFADRVVDLTIRSYNRIDVLFNNAGIITEGTAEDTSPDVFKEVMEVNVFGTFYLSRAVVPFMRRQRSGAIVNNASDWGLVGGPKAVAYCTSKGAVIQLTRAMALDHAREGIRINAICPGDTRTAMMDERARLAGVDPETYIKHGGDFLPIGRMAEPDEIAKAVLFLASDDASFITGAALPVDGGNTCQ